MGERTSGVIVGGILALIGAVIGFWAWVVLSAASVAGSMVSAAFFVNFTFGVVASAVTPAVSAIIPWLILIGAILSIIFAILLIAGKALTISAILVLLGGVLSILAVVMALSTSLAYFFLIGGILELLGAIVALATGAM